MHCHWQPTLRLWAKPMYLPISFFASCFHVLQLPTNAPDALIQSQCSLYALLPWYEGELSIQRKNVGLLKQSHYLLLFLSQHKVLAIYCEWSDGKRVTLYWFMTNLKFSNRKCVSEGVCLFRSTFAVQSDKGLNPLESVNVQKLRAVRKIDFFLFVCNCVVKRIGGCVRLFRSQKNRMCNCIGYGRWSCKPTKQKNLAILWHQF